MIKVKAILWRRRLCAFAFVPVLGAVSLNLNAMGRASGAVSAGNSRQKKSKPELPEFVTDGCSLPDSLGDKKYIGCCVDHDFAYWIGGAHEDKRRADTALINCIREKGAWNFTAGLWQFMLSNFGSMRFGTKWKPPRAKGPLTQEEWEEVVRKSGVFRSRIPVVTSFLTRKKCSSQVTLTLSSITTLEKPETTSCYDLSLEQKTGYQVANLIFSDECAVGFFVYESDKTPKRAPTESMAGYGLCADKIKVGKRVEGQQEPPANGVLMVDPPRQAPYQPPARANPVSR